MGTILIIIFIPLLVLVIILRKTLSMSKFKEVVAPALYTLVTIIMFMLTCAFLFIPIPGLNFLIKLLMIGAVITASSIAIFKGTGKKQIKKTIKIASNQPVVENSVPIKSLNSSSYLKDKEILTGVSLVSESRKYFLPIVTISSIFTCVWAYSEYPSHFMAFLISIIIIIIIINMSIITRVSHEVKLKLSICLLIIGVLILIGGGLGLMNLNAQSHTISGTVYDSISDANNTTIGIYGLMLIIGGIITVSGITILLGSGKKQIQKIIKVESNQSVENSMLIKSLESLSDLKDKGILTEAEFAIKKKSILEKIS